MNDAETREGEFSLVHEVRRPATGRPPYPALILLHGRGSNERDLLAVGPELDERLYVLSLRAPFTLAQDAYYWYDLEASLVGRPSKESIEYSMNLVQMFLEKAIEPYELDAKRVYVGGFSMGGAMAAAMALVAPDAIAGALILSGYLPIHSNLEFRPWDAQGLPIFQAHGTLDPVLPIQYGRMTRDYFQQSPVKLTYKEYPIAHSVSMPELLDAAQWMGQRLDESQGNR